MLASTAMLVAAANATSFTPEQIVARVSDEVKKMLAEPAAKEQLESFSQYPDYEDPATFAKTVADDSEMYKALIVSAKITLE